LISPWRQTTAAGGTLSHLVQIDPTHYTATFTAAPGDIGRRHRQHDRRQLAWAATPAKRGTPAIAPRHIAETNCMPGHIGFEL
jgi:hypothetical protein